jgi:opacity protein-like surface antigen
MAPASARPPISRLTATIIRTISPPPSSRTSAFKVRSAVASVSASTTSFFTGQAAPPSVRPIAGLTTNYPGCVRTFTHNCPFGVGPFFGHDSFSQTRVGWTAGAGIEYAFASNWSVRTEYRLTQFGNSTGYLANTYPAAYPGEHVNASWRRDLNENRVQVGFSYKFNTNQRGLK